MKCTKCGKTNGSESKKCSRCGSPFTTSNLLQSILPAVNNPVCGAAFAVSSKQIVK